jgi:hypothetical protein
MAASICTCSRPSILVLPASQPTAAPSPAGYGDGTYGSLSFSSDVGLGVTLEFKDYKFDVVGAEERDPNRPSRMLRCRIAHRTRCHVFTLLRAIRMCGFQRRGGL